MRDLILAAVAIVLVLLLMFGSRPACAEWLLMVNDAPKITFPTEAKSACQLDKTSWKLVYPNDKVECKPIKEKK